MNIKRIVLSLIIALLTVIMGCMFWYLHYRLNLAPKLLFSMDFQQAARVCPDLVDWRNTAEPWEFVPDDIAFALCEHENISKRNVVSTYHKEIVGFVPYSFHAVKGELKIERSQDDRIYVYSYAKRYAPMFAGP